MVLKSRLFYDPEIYRFYNRHTGEWYPNRKAFYQQRCDLKLLFTDSMQDDYRFRCFRAQDVLKLVLLISKCNGDSIVPLLDEHGFDGLWALHFGEFTLETNLSHSDNEEEKSANLKESVTLTVNKSERRSSFYIFDCPNVKMDSNDLLLYAKKHGIYLVELLVKYNRPYLPILESIAISYSWQRNLIEVLGILFSLQPTY